MNPGKPFHRRHVQGIVDQWRPLPCEVFREYRVIGEGTQSFIDVFVDLDGYRLAVELEMSTRHTVENVRRALAVGCHEVQLVFATSRVSEAAHRKLKRQLPREKLDRVAFLLLSAYQPRAYCRKSRFLTGKCMLQKRGNSGNQERRE